MTKFKVNGRIVSGTELVAIANRAFNTGEHGLSRYGRPTNQDKAYAFLTSELSGKRPKVKFYKNGKWL